MSGPDVTATVSAGLDAVRAGLAGLRDSEFWKVADRDLLVVAQQVEILARLVFTVQVHLAGEIDTRGVASSHGAASTAALLRATLGVSQADARTMVATAAVVLPRDLPSGGEQPPALPVLAGAVDEGGIGVAQTRTVVTTMSRLPGEVDTATRVLCEEQLVGHGRVTEPAPFARFAETVLLSLDQDGKDFDEDPPADHVEFTLGTRNPNTGLTRISGQLDDLGVEIVNQAIDALSKPTPCDSTNTNGGGGSGNGGEPGGGPASGNGSRGGGSGSGASGTGNSERWDRQRRRARKWQPRREQRGCERRRRREWHREQWWWAGWEAAAGSAAGDDPPRPGSARGATPVPGLRGRTHPGRRTTPRHRHHDPARPARRHRHPTRRATVAPARTVRRAGAGVATPRQRPGNRWRRQRRCPNANPGRGAGAGAAAGTGPGPGTGPPVLEYGGPITPAQARALACDARIIPAVLGGASQVLDVGTSNRLFPPHIRRAITLRDKGCTFPGCDRPPGWTDAHHVSFWVENGKTAYHNGCLLCRRHHTEVHRGHWTITFAPDGVPEFTPPPWVDPSQTPRRNTIHNIPALLRQ